MCQTVPASVSSTQVASLQQTRVAVTSSAGEAASPTTDADRTPVRVIRDTYPTYSAVAVDPRSNEVFLEDENLFGLKIFNRLDSTPAGASFTEPKRVLGGIKTRLEFNCGLYIDPKNGDLYSVNNDTTNLMVVFPHDAEGNVEPMRELRTPHGSYGIAVDEEKEELFLTVEHNNAVVVYPKAASGDTKPIRTIEGDRTGLEDPHGIVIDPKNNLMFVSNHGSVSYRESRDGSSSGADDKAAPSGGSTPFTRGTGKFEPPSITVYPLRGSGDVAPLRIIQGPATQMNWPAAMFLDLEHGELYVANDMGDSMLVFRETDSGDVAPSRVIKGPKTGIKNPTGVFVDAKNQEIWASNMGNHSATVYPRTANGDVSPLRTIRSAPAGKLALAIGNPGAAGYDSKRDEILVPN
jgi:DNA-binding beta-propeller fold protein YncE